jgi:hypothetical protein
MDKLADIATSLHQTLGLGPYRPVALAIDAQALEGRDPATIAAAVVAFRPLEGWLWGDDLGPVAFRDGQLPVIRGRLFAAQMVDAAGSSGHLRHVDGDRWIWTVYREYEGTDMLAEDVRQMAREPITNAKHLRYCRYWRLTEGEPSTVAAARFMGFGA